MAGAPHEWGHALAEGMQARSPRRPCHTLSCTWPLQCSWRLLQFSNGPGSPSMHGQEGERTLCTPARGLQLRMCDCMVVLQAPKQVRLTASALNCLSIKLCGVCGLLARLCPCHGAIEGAQHVCRPACLQPKLPCLQKHVVDIRDTCAARSIPQGLCMRSANDEDVSLMTCRYVALPRQASARLI